ncbi:MAG: hypothetical protein KF819_38005 [Labilithrix sp.]|nr:hypothetical protein [Labilithrix sp.]
MMYASLAARLLATTLAVTSADAPRPETKDERTASNVVFLEGFGSGLLYSVNYERIIEPFGLRVGVSYFTYPVSSYGKSGNLSLFTVPMMVSWYTGWESHKVQLGLGATVIYLGAATDSEGTAFGGDRAGAGIAATAFVGYRYLPKDGGLTFGAGFTPLLRGSKALAWGGANVGYTF